MVQTDEILRTRELSRYAVTYDVTEEIFDQIVALLTRLMNAPIGGISLVDTSHVWLKAHQGVAFNCLAREGAFCASAVDSNQEFFCVNDAKEDVRFSQNPLVIEHGVRFYAAAALINNGYCLGTLWVMDKIPRTFQDSDVILMKGLALHVCKLLDVRYQYEQSGLPNLAMFKQNMQAIINERCRLGKVKNIDSAVLNADNFNHAEEKIAFCFLKIHGIHRFNKIYGREATDNLVRDFSDMLKEKLGYTNYYAKISFSKYVFAFFCDHYFELAKKLEEIHKFLNGLFPVDEFQIYLPSTVGVTLYPDHGANVTSLLEQAENAALNTNNNQRSSVRIYTLTDHEERELIADLNREIEQRSKYRNIGLHFQPQVNFLTGELVGLEALARWQHPRLGLIPAHHFIGLAEKNGLIHKLDLMMFRESCQALRSWIDAGLQVVLIANNFSRTTLMRLGVIEEIDHILNEFSIPRDKIEIEITENGFIEQPEAFKMITKQIHFLGLKISIDDFGTGMSNISSFQSVKFDRIKIDRQFIHNISSNTYIEGIFNCIRGICELFDVELICEGVENKEDLNVLKNAKVGCVQGWLFSKSLPTDTIPSILERFAMDNAEREKYLENPLLLAKLFKFD